MNAIFTMLKSSIAGATFNYLKIAMYVSAIVIMAFIGYSCTHKLTTILDENKALTVDNKILTTKVTELKQTKKEDVKTADVNLAAVSDNLVAKAVVTQAVVEIVKSKDATITAIKSDYTKKNRRVTVSVNKTIVTPSEAVIDDAATSTAAMEKEVSSAQISALWATYSLSPDADKSLPDYKPPAVSPDTNKTSSDKPEPS